MSRNLKYLIDINEHTFVSISWSSSTELNQYFVKCFFIMSMCKIVDAYLQCRSAAKVLSKLCILSVRVFWTSPRVCTVWASFAGSWRAVYSSPGSWWLYVWQRESRPQERWVLLFIQRQVSFNVWLTGKWQSTGGYMSGKGNQDLRKGGFCYLYRDRSALMSDWLGNGSLLVAICLAKGVKTSVKASCQLDGIDIFCLQHVWQIKK